MPFCRLELTAARAKRYDHLRSLKSYPDALETLGDHLRKRRLDLRLSQREVARQMGMTMVGYQHWELGWSSPRLSKKPLIERFLGYALPPEIPFETGRRRTTAGRDKFGRFKNKGEE